MTLRLDSSLIDLFVSVMAHGGQRLAPARRLTDRVLGELGIPNAVLALLDYPTRFDQRSMRGLGRRLRVERFRSRKRPRRKRRPSPSGRGPAASRGEAWPGRDASSPSDSDPSSPRHPLPRLPHRRSRPLHPSQRRTRSTWGPSPASPLVASRGAHCRDLFCEGRARSNTRIPSFRVGSRTGRPDYFPRVPFNVMRISLISLRPHQPQFPRAIASVASLALFGFARLAHAQSATVSTPTAPPRASSQPRESSSRKPGTSPRRSIASIAPRRSSARRCTSSTSRSAKPRSESPSSRRRPTARSSGPLPAGAPPAFVQAQQQGGDRARPGRAQNSVDPRPRSTARHPEHDAPD